MALLVILPFPGTVAARLFLLALTLAIAVGLASRKGLSRDDFPPAPFAIAAWVAVSAASLYYSVDPRYTAKELQNEIGYTLFALFSFYTAACLPKAAVFLLRSLAFGCLFIGLLALYGWWGAGFKWPETGLHGGVGVFSTYVVTCVPALFWLASEDDDKRWRLFARVTIVFAIALGLMTLQRAIWPALAAQAVIAVALMRKRRWKVRRRLLLGGSAFLFCAALTAMIVTNKLRDLDNPIPSKYALEAPVSHIDGTDGDPRLPFWPAILRTIAQHPIAGAGFGRDIMQKAYPELVPPKYPALSHAHNVVFNYALQTGLPGAISLLLLFASLIRHFWRRMRADDGVMVAACVAAIMLLVGVFLRNQTNDFFRREMGLLFWALIGIFSALAARRRND